MASDDTRTGETVERTEANDAGASAQADAVITTASASAAGRAGRRAERPRSSTSTSCRGGRRVKAKRWLLGFAAERSAVYHQARESFYDACHSWTMFLVILTSGTAVAALLGESPYGGVVAITPAVLGALDMAFRFGDKGRTHGFLARRFAEVSGAIEMADTEDELRLLEGRLNAIYPEESAEFRAENALAYNQIARRRGQDDHVRTVRWFQRLLRHIVRFEAAEFPVHERGAALG